MSQVYNFLCQVGMQQYYSNFVRNGYESMETLSNVSHSALSAIGIPFDLQETILEELKPRSNDPMAIGNLINSNDPPAQVAPSYYAHNAFQSHPYQIEPVPRYSDYRIHSLPPLRGVAQEFISNKNLRLPFSDPSSEHGSQLGPSLTSPAPTETDSKRKYRRHPKADPNAPPKPQTAYIKFSSSIREGGTFRHLSFTDSAKQVAQRWKDLDSSHKRFYQDEALRDRVRYREQMAVYRTTLQFREYKAYLQEFYEQGGQIVRSVGRPTKQFSPDSQRFFQT